MANIGTLPGERLAGLSADLFHKVQKGIITLDELALFTQRKNPFGFERNEHGHIVITIVGLDLTGAQEIERLEAGVYRMSDDVKLLLESKGVDSYDKSHRLVAGNTYRVALVLGREISKDADRSTESLRTLGRKFGYDKPVGGLIPRIRETVSDKQMEEMGIWYIVSLHDPIKYSNRLRKMLSAERYDGGRSVRTCWDRPGSQWGDDGAFAFPLAASRA